MYSGKRQPDKPLTEDQMFAETLSLVLGDSKIWAAGTYWERNKFTNRTLFAPYAYKKILNTRNFFIEDLARLNTTGLYAFITLITKVFFMFFFFEAEYVRIRRIENTLALKQCILS